MKKKYINLLTFLLLPFVVVGITYIVKNKHTVDTVRAFGHLSVDLGVPSGDPIFVVGNMLPGDCESRTISVGNDGETNTNLAVHSDNEIDIDNLASVLDITISENATTLYQNSLEQFFTDSHSVDGVPLSPLPPSSVKNYTFNICFHEAAGNEFQKTQVIFDLLFGEVISPFKLPAECSSLAGKILFVVEGTEGDDDLRTDDVGELILGYGGNDKLDGQKGNDCIVGGEGDDEIDGGDENDIIIGGPGNDKLDGEDNNDIVYGNEGDDEIKGGQDADILYGGIGNDDLDGKSGPDKIYGEDGDDILDGGPGNDYLNGGPGFDDLDGSTGTDQCVEGEILDSCEI